MSDYNPSPECGILHTESGNMPRYTISIVNYLNTLPFLFGLKAKGITEGITLLEDIPSQCAQRLLRQEADIGLVPVAILPQLPQYQIISPYCLGTEGRVDSVNLYSQCPLEEVEEIVLDYQSMTSVRLTRILCRHFWGIQARFTEARPGFETRIREKTASVIIGDRTFQLQNKYPTTIDLSLEWKKFTGLPFVFAVWASTQMKLPETWLTQWNEALAYGLDHISEALRPYEHQYPDFDPYVYLTERISYTFDQAKRTALDKFLSFEI